MKKTLLFSAIAALSLGAAAQTAVLKDVTPAGLDFSKYEDGAIFKLQHPGGGDDNFRAYSPSHTIYDPAVMASEGHFSTFLRRDIANTKEQLAKDQETVKIHDLGGYLGKCLVISGQWAPLASNTTGSTSVNGPWTGMAVGSNGAGNCLAFFSDPTTHHHGYAAKAVRVRITYTMLRRARHAASAEEPVMLGMYCLEGNNGNYVPYADGTTGAQVTFPGTKYAVFENEGDCVADMQSQEAASGVGVADPFDADGQKNDFYTQQLSRFHVVEFDTYSVGEQNPIMFCLNWKNSHVSLVIKEIKFFEIENATDLLDQAGDPIPGASFLTVREEGYRYYTENGVKEFADGSVPHPVLPGSIDKPYQISKPADLVAMHKNIVKDKDYYFELADDIDMAEVTGYVAAINSGSFDGVIHFNGNNHVIKNLTINAEDGAYPSIFGVLKGEVKNLGVENCTIIGADNVNAGILGGYLAHSSWKGLTTIDNVYVTGNVTTENKNAGGMFGALGGAAKITNSYARVNVKGDNSKCGLMGGTIGENSIEVENCYVSGTVEGAMGNGFFGHGNIDPTIKNCAVIAADIKSDDGEAIFPNLANVEGCLVADDVNADWGTDGAIPAANVIKAIQTWDAFHATALTDGLPVLAWEAAASGVNAISIDSESDAAPVYYNLQGVQVANPTNGLYIVKRGNNVSKQIIR